MNEITKKFPIIYVLGILVLINWFVCGAVSFFLGGDALKTLPSRDGFILISHGQHTPPVPESVWLFSLIYSGATLLLTPLIAVVAFWGMVRQEQNNLKQVSHLTSGIIFGFTMVWLLGWESKIGQSIYISLIDWLKLPRSFIR